MQSSSADRVVVTGVGAVTAAGWGVPALRATARSGATAIGPFDRFDHAGQRTHIAGQVSGDIPSRLASRTRWARLSNSDRFALGAALEAVDQAALATPMGTAAGVFLGSTTGGLFETEALFEVLLKAPESRQPCGPLTTHLYSSPAETVARALAVEGPVETVSSACASGGLAIEHALRALRSQEIDVAIAGGTDGLCLTTYSGFNALRAVDASPCRPFRADRAGLSLGEGAAVLVLERLSHARARGVKPLAEIAGAGSSCDASHMTAPHPEGRGASAAMVSALLDAGRSADSIDFVSAHGTGTPRNDVAEWLALARVFGDRAGAVPVDITKAIFGHLLGAAGALQAVSTILQLQDREVYPTPSAGPTDPNAPACLVFGAPRPLGRAEAAVTVSLGFGGANAAIVFTRMDGE